MKNILVTGASGFLGRRIVNRLAGQGFTVRALVRKTSNTDEIRLPRVELVYGNIADIDSLSSVFVDIDCVIHAAAGTRGSDELMRQVTIEGARNILELCRRHSVRRLIYISSCSVYAVADCPAGSILNESSLLEPYPERRGSYSWAKLDAEKLVLDAIDDGEMDIVCLRPGTIYGPGGENFTPMLGFSLRNKLFIVINTGRFILPLVYVDNLVEAICATILNEKSIGQIYNVVDPTPISKKEYINNFIRKLYPKSRSIYLPYQILAGTVWLQEKIFNVLKQKPVMTLYRLDSSQKVITYDSSKIVNELNWKPAVSFKDAVDRNVGFELPPRE